VQPLPAPGRGTIEQISVGEGYMPDVRGLSARSAIKRLLQQHVNARIAGDGLVIQQSPEPGTPLVPGEDAMLKLSRRASPVSTGGAQQ
jgi:beta-lactam-binding protein with PASTA domain